MKCWRLPASLALVVLTALVVSCRFPSDVVDREWVPFAHVVIDDSFRAAADYHGDLKGIADIDGDGLPDVVFGGNELNWYRYPDWNRTRIAKADEEFSTDMQIADIDGDGDPDLVVPDGKKGALYWFENPRPNGRPASDQWRKYLIGYQDDWAHDVEVGDIDKDGKIDIVTRGKNSGTIVWLQGDAESFKKVLVSTSAKSEGLALTDVNGDGCLDIIENGYWLECPVNLDGAWVRHEIDSRAPSQVRIAVADMNEDGRQDILLAPSESAGGQLIWYEAPKDWRQNNWVKHVVDDDVDFVHSLQVGDVDNDGRPDIVAAEMHQSKRRRVMVYFNDGGSKKWKRQIVAKTGSHNARIADIGNDGDLDIVGANWGGNHHPLELWENKLVDRSKMAMAKGWEYVEIDRVRQKWGDFNEPTYLRYFGLAVGDITGDGYNDIVSGRYFYRNPGAKKRGPWPRVDFGFNVDAMLLVDVDGDGRPEVIAQALPSVFWLKPLNVLGRDWRAIEIGALPKTEHVNSQGYLQAQLIPGGKPEVVFAAGDGIYYFEIPPDPANGNWPRTKIADDTSEEGIGVGDIDGDGFLDVAAASKDGRGIFWWQNPRSAGGKWLKHSIGATVEWADRIAVGDIDGDGRLDVVVTEETQYKGASVYWFQQSGEKKSPSWIRHKIVTQYSTNSMDVADVDGDGDLDIVTGEHRGTRKIAVWENVDRGSSWIEHIIDTGKESHLGAKVIRSEPHGYLFIVSIGWDSYPFLHLWRKEK